MTDTTAPDAITQPEAVDWLSPIVVVGLGGEAPARAVAGPDAEGHYRVDFKQDFWRGLHWFHADGQAVGNTGNIVRNALVPADAHRRLAAHGAGEGLREAWTGGDRIHSLVFVDGQLLLSPDGSGELSFREADLDWSPDGAVDYRTMKLPASEVIAIRDQLNKLFPPANLETSRG